MHESTKTHKELMMSEIQLLLAEKRTYYAILRTGLAVFTVPLSVIVFLIATTKFHRLFELDWIAAIVAGVLIGLSFIGLSTFYRAQKKLNRINGLIMKIRAENKRLAEIII